MLAPHAVQPGISTLHLIERQFFFYLTGDAVLVAIVALLFARLLRPTLLAWRGPCAAVWQQLLLGAAAALLPIALTVLACLAAGGYNPHSLGYEPFQGTLRMAFQPTIWMVWVFFAVQSSFEELLYRGLGLGLFALLLAWLLQVNASPQSRAEPSALAAPLAPANHWFWAGLLANAVVCIAFGLSHRDNPGVTGFAVANIALAGFALGQLFWLQGQLLGACCMHTVWNASLATLGLPVSGILARGPIVGHIHGSVPGLLTGGSFGPEASAVTTLGLGLVSAWLVWRCWRLTLQSLAATALPEQS